MRVFISAFGLDNSPVELKAAPGATADAYVKELLSTNSELLNGAILTIEEDHDDLHRTGATEPDARG